VKLSDLKIKKADANSLSTENLHQEKWESELVNAQDLFKLSPDDPMGQLYQEG
jgi:hypothetical protein